MPRCGAQHLFVLPLWQSQTVADIPTAKTQLNFPPPFRTKKPGCGMMSPVPYPASARAAYSTSVPNPAPPDGVRGFGSVLQLSGLAQRHCTYHPPQPPSHAHSPFTGAEPLTDSTISVVPEFYKPLHSTSFHFRSKETEVPRLAQGHTVMLPFLLFTAP